MLTRVTFICLLVIFCQLREAYAGGGGGGATVEIRRARGVFLLENIQQWAGLRYQFNDHDSDGTNSKYSAHNFDEIYHVGTAFSVLDPHLLRIVLDGELWFHQTEISSDASGSSSGSGSRYQYNINATALDRSWHPVTVYSSLSQDTVVAPFSPTYDTQTGRHGIECSLLKEDAIVKFRFERNSLDISGGGTESSTASDVFDLSGNHNYRGIMSNSLGLSLGYQHGTSQNVSQTGNSYSVNYSNILTMGTQQKYNLTSHLQLDRVTREGLPQQNIFWEEHLRSKLGKALVAEVTYQYNQSNTTISPVLEQDYSTNSISAMLTHHLFQSLETRLRGSFAETDLVGRSESTSSASVGVTYRKELPARSRLVIDASAEHQLTDRKGTATDLVMADKRFIITQPFDVIDLKTGGAFLVPGRVTVMGFNAPPPNLLFPPDRTYVEGIDYTVNYVLGQIVWGAIVPPVTTIVVSYTLRTDPSLEFSTDTFSLSSTLYLLNNRYLVNGYFLNQSYNLISGRTQGLYDTRIARLQLQAFLDKQIYSLIFSDYVAGPTKYRYVEGLWQYNNTIRPMSFHLLARDRYTMYDATDFLGSYTNNSLSISAACSRGIFGMALFMASLNLIDEQDGRRGSSDSIFVRSSIKARFNKLTVELLGSSGWRIYGNSTVRDDYVRFEVQRFF